MLDRNPAPGGAWQHRWDSLTMHDVHGIANLPGVPVPSSAGAERANAFVPAYFADYEKHFDLPVLRPVSVESVREIGEGFELQTSAGLYSAAALVNATGTWDRPFIPWYPGIETFKGRQLHTADYAGAAELTGQHVLVVGGGASAVQLLAEIAEVATTTWVTRREPEWRTGEDFNPEYGRQVVAKVEERVRAGLPPRSVVSVTGLYLRPQEQAAWERGVYTRYPMFTRITPDGVDWADGRHEHIDTILWATGFRADLAHLAPLHLREPSGGIRMNGTATAADPASTSSATAPPRPPSAPTEPASPPPGPSATSSKPRRPSSSAISSQRGCVPLCSPGGRQRCPGSEARRPGRGQRPGASLASPRRWRPS